MQRESQEQQLGFGCAIVSMFGFAITMGMFFVLITMLALWVKAQPHTPTFVTIVVTSTPQVPLTNALAQVALIIPTDTSVPTPLPTIAPTNTPLPTDTPSPVNTPLLTDTPFSISTPLPTNDVLPTFTPIPTALEVEPLKASLMQSLGESNRNVERVMKAEINQGVVEVQWSINDNLTEDMIKTSAKMDVAKLLLAIHNAGLQYSVLNLTGTFATVDEFGKKAETPVVWLTYQYNTVQRISWEDENFVKFVLYKSVYNIADQSNLHTLFAEN